MSKSHGNGNSRSRERQDFRTELADLGEGVGQVKEDLTGLAHTAASAARTGYMEVKESLKETVKSTAAAARERGIEARDSMKSMIEERPFMAVAIAAGVGAIVGAILLRRR